MNKIKILIIPIILFLIALVIIVNLNNVNNSIRKSLPDLPDIIFDELSYFKNEIIGDKFNNSKYVINFFASWCAPCLAEHPTFMRLKEKGVIVIGINFRDDEENLKKWLDTHGNPYEYVIRDEGDIAFELGLIGVPETYFIDKGIIYKRIQGPLFGEDIDEFL
ncbi:redoxin domain-containing protein [Alphaproteobacteria bacterium]|nr:redoxin domain-containing protein [Alphaproteobacteria bacterium]